MSVASFSVRRPVTVAMVFLAIAVLGILSLTRLSLDMFPDIEPPMVSVITFWPGASATDVEQKVTEALETGLSVTPDLDELSAVSMDNISLVSLKFDWGTNLDEATNNIRSLVSAAKRTIPEEVEDSMIFRLNLAQMPVLMFAVTTDRGSVYEHVDFIEDRIVDDIKRVDGVASVVMFNQQVKQLLVEVDRRRMESYGLSLQQVAGALKANNLTLPAGTLDIGRAMYTLRAPGEFESPEDVRNVIVGQHQGSLIYLRDFATVEIGLEERSSEAKVDEQTAMMLMLQRESGANSVDVARAVKKRIAELDKELPEEFHVATIMDLSENIVMMIGSLSNAVYWGGAIVILVVLFFLQRWRTSLIVALSIPTALVAVFAMLAAAGYTLNMITIAAMAIAIGMVVDNTIVVIDNIVRHLELGREPAAAAADGTAEVSAAVTASTLATVAIFLPVLFVGGIIGIFFTELSFVVIVSIAMSLLVALTLVPVLGMWLLGRAAEDKAPGRIARWSERQLQRIEAAYGRVIGWALRNRKKVVVIALGFFAASLLLTRIVGMDFLPQSDGGSLMINAELPIGTNVERTSEVGEQIAGIVKRGVPEAELIFFRSGSSKSGLGMTMMGRQGPNIAMGGCRVPKRSLRSRSTFEMAEAIRAEIEAIPDLVSVEIEASNPLTKVVSGGQKPLTVEIFSSTGDIADLREAARQLKAIMQRTPGAVDVTTDVMDDNPELQLDIDRLAAARVGIPVASIVVAVRTSMYGAAVTRYRGGDEDIDLFLRLQDADRESVADLKNLTVPAMTGAQIRLSSIAQIRESSSPLEIRRMEQQRTLRVMANVSGRALGDVAKDVERAIVTDKATGKFPEGMSTRFGGDVKEQRSMVVDLTIALLLAVLLVYMVMASQFESLLDPFVVMFSVPFGITGTLLALPATGVTLSLTSFIGMIMLVGIVVKNAIVLVDYINLMRDRGMDLTEAIQRGGERRLRPVLMTAFTTIGGMLPLALATGEGSEMWKPMAVAVIGGLLVSTLVTLVLIPCLYAMTDRWRKRGKQPSVVVDPVGAALSGGHLGLQPGTSLEQPAPMPSPVGGGER